MTKSTTSSSRGGGCRLLSAVASGKMSGDPEHVRDVSLVAAAREHMRRVVACKRIEGRLHTDLAARGVLRMLSGYLWSLQERPHAKASPKVREMCMRVLRLEALPPVPESTVPEVLKHLPKSPPRRATKEED